MNRRNFFKLAFASIFSPLIPRITKLLGSIRPILSNIRVWRFGIVGNNDDEVLTRWTQVLCDGDIIKVDMGPAAQDEPLILSVWLIGRDGL